MKVRSIFIAFVLVALTVPSFSHACTRVMGYVPPTKAATALFIETYEEGLGPNYTNLNEYVAVGKGWTSCGNITYWVKKTPLYILGVQTLLLVGVAVYLIAVFLFRMPAFFDIKWNEVTWYSRLASWLVLALVAGGILLYTTGRPPGETYELGILGPSKFVNVAANMEIIEDGVQYAPHEITIKNISFREVASTTYQVFVENQKIGELVAQKIHTPVFSPDDRYVVFKTKSSCTNGSNCVVLNTYAVDIDSPTLIPIPTPRSIEEYAGEDKSPLPKVPYIESYKWLDAHTLLVTFYYLMYGITRVSPKEVWRYDVSTEKYMYLEQLPEAMAPSPLNR